MEYLQLAIAIISEVIATTFLKDTIGFSVLEPTVLSLLFYGIAFYFLSLCMQVLPVSVVYAIWSGGGIILIAIASFFIHKQALDLPGIIGISMIVLGVIVMKAFSKSV